MKTYEHPTLEGIVEGPRHTILNYDDAVFVLRNPSFIPLTADSGKRGAYQTYFSGGTVVEIDGEKHQQRRRLLAPLLRKANLLLLENEAVLPHLQTAIDEASSAPSVDLLPILRRLMLELMSKVTGIPSISDPQNADDFERYFADLEQGIRIRYAEHPEEFFDSAMYAREQIIERYVRPAIEERRAAGDQGGTDDLIGIILANYEHYTSFGDEALYREITVFITAALGSVSNAILHTIGDLSAWVGDDAERQALLTDPAFLNRSFRESQRLHQANPIWRMNTAEVTLPGGTFLVAGSIVDIRRPQANADLASMGESDAAPEAFDPHREVPSGEPDYGLAFGTGSHMCLGRQLMLSDGPHGTYVEGGRYGLAVAILLTLFRSNVQLVANDPPEYVGGVDRQTIKRFPVSLEGS
jgi:cytochrome P450